MTNNKKVLIKKLIDFTNLNGVSISSETYSHLTISLNSNNETFLELIDLYSKFLEITEENEISIIVNENGSTKSLIDIQQDIECDYYNNSEDLRIHFNKLEWFSDKSFDYKISFFIDENNYQNWVKSLDIFDFSSVFNDNNKLIIFLPMVNTNIIKGNNFLITFLDDDDMSFLNKNQLPSDDEIKEHLHILKDNIYFKLNEFKFEVVSQKDYIFVEYFMKQYYTLLCSSIVQVFKTNFKVLLKGIKNIEIDLFSKSEYDITFEQIEKLEKVIIWLYQSDTDTKIKLLVDRLTIETNEKESLVDTIIKNIDESYSEATDRYKFVVEGKSDEYTKELRELLKESKEQTDKYALKTRTIINSLLRDVLGALFFVTLTAYTRFNSKEAFFYSDDAKFIFSILGIYFLISLILQVAYNIWDVRLLGKEIKLWENGTREYIPSDIFNKYISTSLKSRTFQFSIIQFIIGIMYLVLIYISFNATTISKNVLDSKKTEITQKEIKNEKKLLNNIKIVNAHLLNVRNRPSLESDIVTQLPRGSIVKIIKIKNNWCYILKKDNFKDNLYGWVNLSFLLKV